MPDAIPKLITRFDVERITGFSTSTVYRLMRRGEFPLPIRIGGRAVRWREADVRAYLESRPHSNGDGIVRNPEGGRATRERVA